MSPVNPQVVYAIYADETGYFKGIYKTTDGGNAWVRIDNGSFDDYSSFVRLVVQRNSWQKRETGLRFVFLPVKFDEFI